MVKIEYRGTVSNCWEFTKDIWMSYRNSWSGGEATLLENEMASIILEVEDVATINAIAESHFLTTEK